MPRTPLHPIQLSMKGARRHSASRHLLALIHERVKRCPVLTFCTSRYAVLRQCTSDAMRSTDAVCGATTSWQESSGSKGTANSPLSTSL
eukprot:3330934-Rhodomonas_salina.1